MSTLTKEEIFTLYNHDDLPKIKNFPLYCFRCVTKIVAIIFFGLGAMFLAIFVFPFIRLFSRRKGDDFGIDARAYVSKTFRHFLGGLQLVNTSILKISDREDFMKIQRKIVIANHPSLLDFVYIMSLCPNSTCIVRGGLVKTPLGGVIKQAYITNTTDFDDVLKDCKKLTDQGCNVIIFPEGTRSPRHGQNSYKKGAARIALYCNCDVQPIFIGGTDKFGLGKHDPLWGFNHVEPYIYDIQKLPIIKINDYQESSEPIAAKHLTQKMEEVIRSAGKDYAHNSTWATFNNF